MATTFSEWLKQQKAAGITTFDPKAAKTNTTSTKGTGSTGNTGTKPTFTEWLKQQKTAGVTTFNPAATVQTPTVQNMGTADGWARSGFNLVNEIQQHYSTWRNKDEDEEFYNSVQERASSLLANATNWRNQFRGDAEALEYINSVVDVLSEAKNRAYQYHNYYSQWNDIDSYNAAQRQYEYQQKYTGKGYDEIQNILRELDTGEEKDWLSEYSKSNDVMTAEVYEKLIADIQPELEERENWNQSYILGDEAVKDDHAQYTENRKRIRELERRMEELQGGQWRIANEDRYGSLQDSEDFARVSSQVAEDPTAKFGIQFGDNWLGFGDPIYDYINDIDGAREKLRFSGDGQADGDAALYKYTFMNDREISTYNYIHNTEGKKAAGEYLEYLTYDLDARRQQQVAKDNAAFATDHPVLSSLYSIPANLVSGAGLIDVAWQNAAKNIKEAATGEYAGPINYSSAAMTPNTISTSIRGTVAQGIANGSGVIELDTTKHPLLSRLLNGKSMGDVYQLGMSMADSAAVALLSPIMGSAGVALLGGSAGTQGVLTAIEAGATDEQALALGILNGAFEMIFEKISLDNLLKGNTRSIIKSILQQGFVEGTEELNTSLFNNIADVLIMAEKSGYKSSIAAYMEQGLSEEEATKRALQDAAIQLGWDFVGGFFSGGIMGGGSATIQRVGDSLSLNAQENAANQELYGDNIQDLVGEALELNPDSSLANRLQGRLDSGKEVSGRDITRLVKQNETAMLTQDRAAIQEVAAARLTELGETGNVQAIAAVLTKQAEGKKLSAKEAAIISESKYGQRVANELNTANIRSGDYSAAWAQQINTNRINAEEYSSFVEAAQQPQEAAKTKQGKVVTPAANVAQAAAVEAPAATDQESLQVTEEISETAEAQEEPVTLEAAAAEYGAQAQAMIHTYQEGQDVERFNSAYRAAYDMGRSGVSIDYALRSEATSYLTEAQRGLAYEAGEAAANTAAHALDAKNKADANGKTGWEQGGVVRGEGVTMRDLKDTFHDTRGTAYKALSTIAKVTGVNIVLYKSETDADGNFVGAQGRYKRSEPGTIYIDINAGLENVKDANDLAKYAMLRTFSHEFTHFIENWNPIQYNEFRKVVFDTLTRRGQNANELIETKQAKTGLSYEMASREVVAEAMTDILPDANFVETLATKHQRIFNKLIQKLKEFAANLRNYFNSIGQNRSTEANALKEQVGENVKYLDSIVQLFDNIAAQAVENYQQTVATDVITENAAKIESAVTENAPINETSEAKTETDPLGFTIADNLEYGSLEITFDGKPSAAVRDVLRANKFRWHGKKKVWYGYGDRAAIKDVLHTAYEAEAAPAAEGQALPTDFETVFNNATQEERDEVVAAMDENMGKPSRMYPTEIRETQPIGNHEEVITNGTEETGTVLPDRRDGERDSRLLESVETGAVQGTAAEGDTLDRAGERGNEAGRHDHRTDAKRNERGHGEGSSQSGDLRRNDGLTAEGVTDTDVGDKTDADTNVPSKETEKLHEEVAEQIAQQSTEKPKGRNFVIGDSLNLPNGEKARYKVNVAAIRLVKKLEAEGRYATEFEQTLLSKYVGWGGLANAFDERKADWSKEYKELKELLTDEEYAAARGSTLNAHYTDISVIKAMYDGLRQLGFTGGRMLEPSSGTGNFVGAMPTDMSEKVRSWTMVELDNITGHIAKYLYPNADVRIQGFEKANIPDNFMDVAISNVPFGNYAIADKSYPKKLTSAIHNYFFAKSLDKVRPGGIVMFITSSYTMNSKDSTVRRYIMKHADLLGAIRLPDTAFKGNAGTEVVTDILVLKKRAANTDYAGQDFLEAPYQYISGYQGANINSYFASHPEMVLGTPSMEGIMYRGASLTYKALEGKGSLADQIREAFTHIQGKMEYPAQISPEKTNFATERANKKTKENGLVVKEGKVYQNKGGELQEMTVAKGAAERIAGMLEIRDAAKALQTYQQQGLNDTEIRKARQKLNKAYDAFVKKHGFLNAQANRNAIKDDPDKFSIFALENYNPETKKATKADIFSKNTIAPNRTVTSAKDTAEGLIVSVNQTGGVDTALIARLTGKTEEAVTRELIDSRAVFKTRNGGLETAEVYLSGNVRAKLRDAEALVPMDADYQKNVEALKSVMPEDVGYQDIFVNPGTPWIPSSVYSDFAAYMLGSQNTEWSQAVDVTRNAETGNFTVELKNRYLKTNSYNTQKWGTNRRSFLELFDAMLNSKSVVIKYKTEDGKSVVDRDATAAANEKVENIQKEFQDWLWKDEGRRTELATLYNETFNSVVTPKYNGDNLTVNGANAMKPLRPHQRNAVQRIISSGGNTLLAHKVGAGKTYEMAAAAMKLKQLGLVKKPMFAVPKSLVAQWGNEFMDFFPTAKLLVAEANDFTAANRKIFMNRIANGEYDAVIVSYEQFERLPISADFARELYQEQIDSIIRAIEEAKAEKGGKSLSVKDLEKKRKSLQTKIDKLSDSAKDEENIDFEQLGVDSLFIDEAHNFKNLFYTTSMTNVSGLGNKDGSKRAFDLYTKVRYLQKLNGGRGIVFATATPVMNSMSEMYIMQKYLQPDLLDQLGLSTFDAWAKQFGEVVNGVEIKPSGQGYRVKQSFSRFKNMSELQLLFRNFADVLTDIPGLKIPKMKGGKVNVVVCEPGQFQQDYMKELEQRADNIKNVDPSVDNMLKITSDGRKISYTQRMIDPSLPYEEGSKIFRCADNVARVYQESKANKGTQLIFCDMATPKGKSTAATTETEEIETDMESARLYDDIRTRLVKSGIPGKEIAFIHEADTDAKKKKLFADVNDGKVRVLIGSTGKMGVGMNAQKRIVAIHHLDAPWRPGDVEQRNGRAYRQGNINDEVENFTYVTEGSFDARLWDILERKQNFINQVMNGENVGREAEDTGEVTLSAAEVKALASGSPLIMEQVQLDTDIKKLESLRRAHNSAVTQAKQRMETDKGEIAKLEAYIAAGQADIATRTDTYAEDKFSITVGKTKLTDKKDAGAMLMAAATAKATEDGYTTIAKFAGFDLRVIKTHEGIKGLISGNQGYSFNTYPGNTTYMMNHIIAKVEGLDDTVKEWQQRLINTQNDMAEQEKLIAQPFAKQAELDQKRARYNEVMEILNPKEEQALDSMSEDMVQEQSRNYLSAEAAQFRTDIDRWDNAGRPEGEAFILGSTGDVLQGLGAIESDIYMLSDKINTIFEDHPEMTVKEIKNIPEILENPVMVMASRNLGRGSQNNTRLTIFGMVKAQNGLPVLVAFDLHPSENKLYLADMQKVVSAYTKDSSPTAAMNLIENSEVLYADKNKTASLLHTVGFQNAYRIEQSGYIGNITYENDEVKVYGKKFSDVFTETEQEQSRAYLSNRDSDGNQLSEQQQAYFQDSKARDRNGNLEMLYHGTTNGGFTVFDPQFSDDGISLFASNNINMSATYSGSTENITLPQGKPKILRWTEHNTSAGTGQRGVYKVYFNLTNPLIVDGRGQNWDRISLGSYQDVTFHVTQASGYANQGSAPVNVEITTDGRRSMRSYASVTEMRADIARSYSSGIAATLSNMTARGLTSGNVDVTHNVHWNTETRSEVEALTTRELAAQAKREGYDGLIVRNIIDSGKFGKRSDAERGTIYVAFQSEQIKAVENKNPTGSADIRYQQRTSPLTDREALTIAASEIKTSDLSEAEKGALDIFQKRLSKLEALQEQRAEEGRRYKEQQFGAKVDRAKAAETLNRMRTLDAQIQKASNDVLSVEEKEVLRRVLKKARAVVERQEREHGQEILKRWRDRRNNAADIKKYRDRLRGDVDELTNWVLHPNNKDVVKHIPDALKNSVIPFLSSINFISKQSLKGGNPTIADKEFMKRLKDLKAALKQDGNVDRLYEDYSDLPPNFMDRLQTFIDSAQELLNNNSGDFIINQMTAAELKELSQVVRTLKEYIKNFNKFHANAMFQHVYEAGNDTISTLAQMDNASGKTGVVSNFVLWQQMRPAYAFERFGEGGKAIYDGLRRGQATLAFNTKKIQEFAEKAYTEKEVRAWEKQIKEIKLGDDTVKMPVSTIMSFYELSKRPQALGHILGEGIRVATFKDGGHKISDIGHVITPEDVKSIIGQLTDRQKEVADNLQKFMQEQGGKWGNYVSVKRFGEELFGEEHYFPINSDGRHLSANADEHPSAASLYALLNMGFTKATQEGANNRLVLYSIFDVFANHMASMAQYHAFALPVVDALKWFNYQQKSEADENGKRFIMGSVRDQMDRVYGVPEESRPGSGRQGYAQNFVISILRAFNGTEAQGAPLDAPGLNALRRYNMAQVAYNFRVVLQQPLAVTRAGLLMDYTSILKGMKLNPAAIRKNIREMRQYSGIAAWKSLGFYDVNISRGLTEIIKHSESGLEKINEFGMKGAELADTLTWAAMWSAAKEEVIRKKRLRPGDTGFYEAVTTLFEDVIYKTQVVDSVLTKNEYLRSKGFWARAMGSFMSEPTTTASMLVDAYDKYSRDMQRGMTRQQAWRKNGRYIGRVAYVYALGAVLLAAAQAVGDGLRDDDDYQTFFEKWLEAFGGNLVDEILPFNKLPIVSDFYEVAKELIATWTGLDIYGNAPSSVFMQWYDSLIKGAEIIHGKITGEEERYTWYGGIYKLLQAASGMTGLPMATATRELVTAWNNVVGAMAPSLKLQTYDSGEKNEIKYAYEDGYLTDEEARALLLEKGLVDNENEAYFAMQEWEAGEGYSRYDAIYDVVRNGGSIDAAMDELTSHGYAEKDVLSQTKSQIGEWYRGGEISKQQAIDMLTKHFDLDSDEITKIVNEWSSEVVTGIAYDDIKDAYLNGEITEDRAIEMRALYGGYSQEDAAATVNEWRSEKETGIAYSDAKSAFMDGEISAADIKNLMIEYGGKTAAEAASSIVDYSRDGYKDGTFSRTEAANMMVNYGGLTSSEAEAKLRYIDVKKQLPDTYVDDAWVAEYYAEVQASGITLETFVNYRNDVKGITGEGKKENRMAVINSLPISPAQKDALYYAEGWAESRIYEAPWH